MRAQRSCELQFASHAERELFYLAVNKLREVPTELSLRIFLGTYNMGSAPPNHLHSWIPVTPVNGVNRYHLYVIGTQENKWKKGESEGNNWIDLIRNHLGSDYELLAESTMWEIGLVVFAHSSCVRYITNIEVSCHSCQHCV